MCARLEGDWLKCSTLLLCNFPVPYQIIGDSGYPSLDCLLTPVKETRALTAKEVNYNQKHSSTRMVVEHAFGLVKGKWTALTSTKCSRTSLQRRCEDVIACCCLHNIELDIGTGTDLEDLDVTLDVEDDTGTEPSDLFLQTTTTAVRNLFVSSFG